jgi:hypothetical protein
MLTSQANTAFQISKEMKNSGHTLMLESVELMRGISLHAAKLGDDQLAWKHWFETDSISTACTKTEEAQMAFRQSKQMKNIGRALLQECSVLHDQFLDLFTK